MKKSVFTALIQTMAIQMLTASCPPSIPPLPALPVPTPANPPTSTCDGPSPDVVANFMPIVIVNNSGLSADDVYITVLVNSLTQFLEFVEPEAELGNGEHVLGIIKNFTPVTYLSSLENPAYSYKLSSFENLAENQYVFYIPNTGNTATNPSTVMKSSRIYISLNQPLDFFIDHTNTLQQPSELDISDDNYYTLNDKVEFDLGSNAHNRLNLNLTGVDFFGLPLLVQADYQFLFGSNFHEVCMRTGMPSSVSLANIFEGFSTAIESLQPPFDGYWKGLIAEYTNPNTEVSTLRIFAPATAMRSSQTQSNPTPIVFPANYFLSSGASPSACSWYNAVWLGQTLSGKTAFYQQKPTPYLVLNADTTLGTGIATGNAYPDGSFVFVISGTGTNPTRDKGATITFPRPTSSAAFFTGAVSDYEPAIVSSASAETNAQVLKSFATPIIAGFFPINCKSPVPITIDQTYLENNSATYFQNNSILTSALSGCSCVGNVPWYDFYSRTLLTIGTRNIFYTSAYSDYLGTDGSFVITELNTENAEAVVSIYLGDCSTDITFPAPFSDDRIYTVSIGVPRDKELNPLLDAEYSTDGGLNYTPYTTGTFTSQGDELYVRVTYTSGVYNGQTFTSRVSPNATIFKPTLAGGGTIFTTGLTTQVSLNASP